MRRLISSLLKLILRLEVPERLMYLMSLPTRLHKHASDWSCIIVFELDTGATTIVHTYPTSLCLTKGLTLPTTSVSGAFISTSPLRVLIPPRHLLGGVSPSTSFLRVLLLLHTVPEGPHSPRHSPRGVPPPAPGPGHHHHSVTTTTKARLYGRYLPATN